jgi:hypothetical protein
MSLRSSALSTDIPRDLELLPNEKDPLLSSLGNETYGKDEEAQAHIAHEGNRRSSIRESRRFEPWYRRLQDVIRVYWHLGVIAFGGPSAHVAILRDHLVRVHAWMEEDVFMELFALGKKRIAALRLYETLCLSDHP